MSTSSGGMKSALRPLGAALVGGGVALAGSGVGPVVGGALIVVGIGLIFAGGSDAPPPPPPPPALPPIPQPGNTVSGAAFGSASTVGTSADFARADHDHGLPALPPPPPVPALPPIPQPGRSVSSASFGSVATVGTSADFARADHDHGLPSVPPPAPLPAPGGDATGTLTALRVTALQGVPVAAGTPQAGDVLTFANGNWAAQALPVAPPPPPPPAPPPPVALPPLDFVGRGDRALRVVAAGEVELKLHNGTVNVALVAGYGGLKPVVATPGSSRQEYLLVVQAADGANPSGDAYVVQLTPMRATAATTVFTAGVQGAPINDGNGAVRFTATLSSPADLTNGAQVLRVAVLLLRFAV